MVKEIITLVAKEGFHARPASQFVKMANGYQSEVSLSYQENTVNGKSIMGILTLGAACGSEVTLTVEGEDEAEALSALGAFVKVME